MNDQRGLIRAIRLSDLAEVLPNLESWVCCSCGRDSTHGLGGFVMRGGRAIAFCDRADCLDGVAAGTACNESEADNAKAD